MAKTPKHQVEGDSPLPATKPVTLTDVAKAAGVSTMTVSRVLNGTGRISDKTRSEVQSIATSLGYVPNLNARQLRTKQTNTLGLVLPDLSSQYVTEIVRGATEEAERHNKEMLLHITRGGRTMQDQPQVTLLSHGLVDGLIMLLPLIGPTHLKALTNLPIPVVVVGYAGQHHFSSIQTDNQYGAQLATQHLIDLGHTRIAFLEGTNESPDAQARRTAFLNTMQGAGLPTPPEYLRYGHFEHSLARSQTHELLNLPQRPTAIFCANDSMAFGAYEAIQQRGLRIPEDISIVGFDDVPSAAQVHPPLTTVRQPLHDMGEQATQTLLNAFKAAKPRPRKIILPAELIVRESTRAVQR